MNYRNVLGRPLTKEEVDANFLEMENLKTSMEASLQDLQDVDLPAVEQVLLDFNTIQNEFEQFDATIKATELGAVYDDYNNQLSTVETDIGVAQGDLNTLQTDLTTAQTDAIDAVNSAKTTALADIETARVQALQDLQDFVDNNT